MNSARKNEKLKYRVLMCFEKYGYEKESTLLNRLKSCGIFTLFLICFNGTNREHLITVQRNCKGGRRWIIRIIVYVVKNELDWSWIEASSCPK